VAAMAAVSRVFACAQSFNTLDAINQHHAMNNKSALIFVKRWVLNLQILAITIGKLYTKCVTDQLPVSTHT
jgi:hypothetical protein